MDLITSSASMAPNGAKVMNVDVLPTPYYPSWSYICSLRDWTKIRDILGGADEMRAKRIEIACPSDPNSPNAAKTMRGENPYIQRFALESDADYDRRLRYAPFENHFFDALDSVCDKPFTKNVVIRGDAPDEIKKFAEDVDGQGTTLHEYARSLFKEGAAFGIAGLFVDYPTLAEGSTLADQRKINARPYWIEVVAEDLLTFRKASFAGRQYIAELRFVERREEAGSDGSIVRILRTVRVYRQQDNSPVTFEIWRESSDAEWKMDDKGTLKGVTAIPFKEFITGRRDRYTGRIISPMLALADLQITHFQQNTNLQRTLDNAAFPMLCGNGINPPIGADGKPETLQTGPGAVLYGPPMVGSSGRPPNWAYLEPKGDSIKALMDALDRIVAAIDKLGKAPLIKSTGSVTATSDAISAAKGHATAEVWAGLLAKTLSAAFDFTAQYLGIKLVDPVDVEINTDFGIEDGNIADGTELRNAVADGVISLETYWEEMQRRAILSSAFNADKEKTRIAEDQERKMEQQKQALIMQAAYGAKAAADGSSVKTPPPGSSPGPTSDLSYARKQTGASPAVN